MPPHQDVVAQRARTRKGVDIARNLCDTRHMSDKAAKGKPTITAEIRKALAESGSLYRVAKETGVQRASLIRFLRGDQSLRLDKADILAAYFGIEVRRKRR